MTLLGKGFFIWKIQNCENGDVSAIARLTVQADMSHILVKIADGTYSYNLDTSRRDMVPPVVQSLHAAGVQVWGWHYLYGDDPLGEANKAIQRIQQTGVDGYVIDVEKEYKVPGKSRAAVTFMNRLRSVFPSLPVALCSYRFPSYHPQIPWKEFLARCDINMPQVYWQGSHNPADQLSRCINEFQTLTPFRPIIPAGSAYKVLGWAATRDDANQFLQTAQTLNLNAANFWEWSNCRRYLPEVWNAIHDYPWSGSPLPADIALQYIAALNTHDPEQILNLYSPTAVHVNASRTVQGTTALRVWFQSLLTQILPEATFILTGYTGTGSTRNITWTATSNNTQILDGNDTIGILNGKISYHYTYFNTINEAKYMPAV